MTLDRSIAPRCNIGPAELARRRRSAYASTAATALAAIVLLLAGAPPAARLLLWPVAAGAAVAWLQVIRRFCVAFGTLGLENFGGLGRQVAVDATRRGADRRLALRMILEGVAIGLAVALGFAILPV